MRKLILEPLHSDYIHISLTTTDLDDPFQWQTTQEKQEENFEWWDILHSVLLNWLLCKEKAKYVIMFYANDIDSKKMDWLRKCMKLAESLPELLMIEQKKRLRIEYWKYLITLTWKFDGLFIDPENGPTLIDIKTAATIVDYESKIQLKMYWFLNNIPNVQYRAFSKSAKPELSIHKFHLNLEENKKEVVATIIQHMEEKYWYVNEDIKTHFIWYSNYQ